jgi:hypothetical protein
MSEIEMKFNAEAEVTRKPNFKPIADKGNLCLGKLVGVTVEMKEQASTNEDGSEKTWEMAGKTIPSLVFHYENHKINASEADREFRHRESMIGTMKKDGSEISLATLKNLYDQMWARIKHIHDGYAKCSNYAKIGAALAKAGEALYNNATNSKKTTESTIKVFTAFFDAVADAFTKGKDGKPIYMGAKESIPMWLKLVADYSTGKYLDFPTFVGDGFVEVYRAQVEPAIELKANETITLTAGKGKSNAPANAGVEDDLDPEVAALLKQNEGK